MDAEIPVKNEDVFAVRRIPLAPLYRNRLVIGLECPACGGRFTVEYNKKDWRGRAGKCPACRHEAHMRPGDLRWVLENSFRRAVKRIEKLNISVWNDILAYTIARAAVLLEPILMLVIVHYRHDRIGHYVLNQTIFLWWLEDLGWGEALLFVMPRNKKVESNHYLGEKWEERFITAAAAIPAFHMVEKKMGLIEKLVWKCRYAWLDMTGKLWPERTAATGKWTSRAGIGHAEDLAMGWPSNKFEDRYANGRFEGKTLPLSFSEKEKVRARKWFDKMGLDYNAPFVCFLGRDATYLDSQHAWGNWHYHDHRNMDADTFLPAMNWLAEQGVTCLRMGSVVAKPLSRTGPRVVDYAVNGRDEFMDLFLFYHCSFCVSSATGPDIIPLLLRKWMLYVNIPFICLYPNGWMGEEKRHMFKKVWSHEKRRFLTFREMFDEKVDVIMRLQECAGKKISLVDNSSREILSGVQEIHAHMLGTWQTTDEERAMREKYLSMLRNAHPGLRKSVDAKLCHSFLRENTFLFE